MVDALEAAWRVVRPRGLVVDLQPHASYQPRVAVRDARRLSLGAIVRDPDEDVLAAHAARDRLVERGRFRLIASGARWYRAAFRSFASFEEEVRDNSNWHLPRGFRSRLLRAWRERDDEARIEVAKRFSYSILRKTIR